MSSSNLARVSVSSRLAGPFSVRERYGSWIEVLVEELSSFFACSAASLRRCLAILSFETSTPVDSLKRLTRWSTMRWSQSSPPRRLSPAVERTWMVLKSSSLPTSRRETSNVPPPRSKTRMSSSSLPRSRPYARAAAVGSLMMRSTLRPAISPASFVAWRSASLKYAGTVMTASVTESPRYCSASRLSLPRMRADSSCDVYFLTSMPTVQSVPMWRLTDEMVRSSLVTFWRLAVSRTSTSPSLVNATTDGVVRAPSALAMTVGSPPSRTETTELVVPRSIPTARAMGCSPSVAAAPGSRGSLRVVTRVSRGVSLAVPLRQRRAT